MSGEKWAYAPGYGTSYSVSDAGRVVSHVRTRGGKQIEMFSWVTSRYRYVSLCKFGRNKNVRLHRLVAMAFVPNPDNKPCVNHKNGNREDNSASNLEWVTHSENTIHAYRSGLLEAASGEGHGMAKLTEKQVLAIRAMYSNGSKCGEIARAFSLPYNTVYSITHWHRWKKAGVAA